MFMVVWSVKRNQELGMKQFKASVQYNDMTGTAAADVADSVMLKEWLEQKGQV